jgi:hypothetical protein
VSLASGRPAGAVRPGYVITRTGVHLGMTPALTRHMAFVKLTPKAHPPGVPDWNGAPMTVSVDGVSGQGTLLMDTGINYMFLSPPAGTRLERGRRAPEGTMRPHRIMGKPFDATRPDDYLRSFPIRVGA